MEHTNNDSQANLPHHVRSKTNEQPANPEIDYGLSQSEDLTDQQQAGQPGADTPLSHRTDTEGNPHLMRDGYAETQGSGYNGPLQNSVGQPQSDAQKGYDPTHSGVRHSKDKPGERVAEPGRETGTAWSEEMQMGKTDTPDRGNPAN